MELNNIWNTQNDQIQVWTTTCSIKYDNGSARIGLSSNRSHTSINIVLPKLHFIEVYDNKLCIRHNNKRKTFYSVFPNEPFIGLQYDLLTDIWWTRKQVKDRIPELT